MLPDSVPHPPQTALRRESMRSRYSRRAAGWGVRLLLAAALLISVPVPSADAHTCIPDPTVGVGGRLLVPRGSAVAAISLPSRETRQIAITPASGNATAVALSPDGSLLAVPRFWRPP